MSEPGYVVEVKPSGQHSPKLWRTPPLIAMLLIGSDCGILNMVTAGERICFPKVLSHFPSSVSAWAPLRCSSSNAKPQETSKFFITRRGKNKQWQTKPLRAATAVRTSPSPKVSKIFMVKKDIANPRVALIAAPPEKRRATAVTGTVMAVAATAATVAGAVIAVLSAR